MSVPMFSHFKMEVVQFFSSAQRRKADEGVYFCQLRIKHHVIRASAETCYGYLECQNMEILSS